MRPSRYRIDVGRPTRARRTDFITMLGFGCSIDHDNDTTTKKQFSPSKGVAQERRERREIQANHQGLSERSYKGKTSVSSAFKRVFGFV